MKRLFLAMIRFYRRNISPYFPGRCRFIPTCSAYATEAINKYGAVKGLSLAIKRFLRCHPFVPTCSAYAYEAIEKYGAWKGGFLALKRLLRCHPFYKGDPYDPVP